MTVVLLTTFTGVGLTTDLASGEFDRFRTLPIWRPAPSSDRCSATSAAT